MPTHESPANEAYAHSNAKAGQTPAVNGAVESQEKPKMQNKPWANNSKNSSPSQSASSWQSQPVKVVAFPLVFDAGN
jgi:hypothetical protein